MLGHDFLSFYTASKIARTIGYYKIYDIQIQSTVQGSIAGQNFVELNLLPFIHPPYLIPLNALIFHSQYNYSFLLWQVVSLILLIVVFYIFTCILKASALPIKHSYAIALCGILFYPLLVSLLKGQDTLILLGSIALWAFAVTQKNHRIAGLALAVATIRPQIALGLVFPFFFVRRKVLRWFFFGMLVLGIYSLFLVGFDGAMDYLQLLGKSAAGEAASINHAAMFNIIGLVTRIFPNLGISFITISGWILYIGALLLVGFLWKKQDDQSFDTINISLTVMLVTLSSPHLHYHDLAIVIIPLLMMISSVFQKGYISENQVVYTIISCSLLFMFTDAAPFFLKYTLPYLWLTLPVIRGVYLSNT